MEIMKTIISLVKKSVRSRSVVRRLPGRGTEGGAQRSASPVVWIFQVFLNQINPNFV